MRWLPVLSAALLLAAAPSAVLANSSVSIAIAGEAYEGAPTFQIRMGDLVIGQGVVAKAIDTETEGRLFGVPSPLPYLEHFDFEIPDADFLADAPISIVLTNDRYLDTGDGYDRNLFIQQIVVNGVAIPGERIKILEYGSVEVDVPMYMGLRPLYGSGQVAVVAPPPQGWPALGAVGAVEAIVPLPPPRPSGM